MPNNELEDFSHTLWESLALADRKMIEDKAQRGEMLAYSTLNGEIFHIAARDLLNILSGIEASDTTHSLNDD